MTFDEFLQSQQQAACPTGLSVALQGLWYAQAGDWHKAHQTVQDAEDADSAWVHAYLHRQEGDLKNAHYWYHRSGKPASNIALPEEWQEITRSLLKKR